jgi:hypothetical protein
MATTQSNPVMDATANGYAAPGAAGTSAAALVRRHGLRQIRAGVVWFAIGLVITVVTFQHPIGGIFVAAYGPMIFGVISVIRGIATVAKSTKLAR